MSHGDSGALWPVARVCANNVRMDLGIAGRRAVICGSSRGLGRACAEALANEGVEIVLNGRDPDRLEEARSEVQSRFGVTVGAVAADVTTQSGRSSLLAVCPSADI